MSITHIICQPCIGTKDTACVDVCPVDCIYGADKTDWEQCYIHPEECIDCTLCVPECPIDAIYAEDDLPGEMTQFIELNAELAAEWPVITEKKDSPTDAKDWENKPGKLQYLER